MGASHPGPPDPLNLTTSEPKVKHVKSSPENLTRRLRFRFNTLVPRGHSTAFVK